MLKTLIAVLLVILPASAPKPADPLVHTYSIVARDPATGEMGVAVQSHWFAVGSMSPGRRLAWGPSPRRRASIPATA